MKKYLPLVLALLLLSVTSGWGEDSDSLQGQTNVQSLPEIEVLGSIDNPATGKSTLQGEIIRNLPQGNRSINEILDVFPDVRLSDSLQNSLTGGEILPPNVSISGGRVYQNNFTLDGISNNSLIDPTGNDPNSVTDVPGHPQEVFIDANLVESITLYDSNIPARYGQFTGGVIEAQLRDPGPTFSGDILYRTTRDEWTNFFITNQDRYSFENSRSADKQPNFEKHDAAVTLNIPLNERMGVLTSYRLLDSTIPHYHLGETIDETRRMENFFLKYLFDISADDTLTISSIYTPYEEDRVLQDVKDSDYTLDGGGYVLSTSYRHAFLTGDLKLQGAYRWSENSREAPKDYRIWANTPSADWGANVGLQTSRQGGYGDIEKTQESTDFIVDWQALPIEFGPTSHTFNTGIQYEWTQGVYDRKETSYIYDTANTTAGIDIICGDNTFDCIDGEQFFTRRRIYQASETEATINLYSAYLDDRIEWQQFQVTPGVRVDYDDYMENLNVAPRLAAAWDLFADRKTIFSAGYNRYYGRSLLTYSLREAILPYYSETRTSYQNQPTEWERASYQGFNVNKFSELDTPYSDEVMVGIDQALFGGRLSLKYVHRQNQDEFFRTYGPVMPDGLQYYTMTNDGRSIHRSYRASWERQWLRHFLSLNVTYRESDTSNEDYDDLLEDADDQPLVYYQGKLWFKGDLPGDEFRQPYEIKLTYIGQLPWGLTFTNFTKYRSSYTNLENTYEEMAIPTTTNPDNIVYTYDKKTREAALTFDWKLRWEHATWENQKLALDVEIYNVFNSKIETVSLNEVYELGRQFWLGAEYSF